LLATALGADQFVISTAVRHVCLEYRTPQERPIKVMTLDEAREYLAAGQFGEGSMAPKIRAVIRFLERGGRRAVIASPEDLELAVAGRAGTQIVR